MSTEPHILTPLQPQNPLRPVDWRWRRAAILASREQRDWKCERDPLVQRAVRYILGKTRLTETRAMDDLARQYPDLYEADQICEQARQTRWMLEGALLSGESAEAIGQAFGVRTTSVELYAQLFFDVQDRLACRAFILGEVLDTALRTGFDAHNTDKWCKVLGYHGYRAKLGMEPILSFWDHGQITPDVSQFFENLIIQRAQLNVVAAVHTQSLNSHTNDYVVRNYLDARRLQQEQQADQDTTSVGGETLQGLSLVVAQVNKKLDVPRQEPRALEQVSQELRQLGITQEASDGTDEQAR